jgi:lipopolysaccharide/colanic/teichoic acid biosynthesis glycosyltransferase
VKRVFDIGVAVAGTIVLSPVMLAVACAVMIDDGAPVLFRQSRRGRFGIVFPMLKFRTMRVNAPDLRQADGSTFSGKDDPRVTRIGRFLRDTSLDELPQLMNVMRGDMSLVGPRPDLPDHGAYDTPEDQIRLEMRPGITGLAQVRGRNAIAWRDRRRFDRWYVRHWSLSLDLWILVQTVAMVLQRRGVTAPAAATARSDRKSPSAP